MNIAAAKVSKTLADMLAAMGCEGQTELAVTIDLQVDGDMLEAVLEWCQRYQGERTRASSEEVVRSRHNRVGGEFLAADPRRLYIASGRGCTPPNFKVNRL